MAQRPYPARHAAFALALAASSAHPLTVGLQVKETSGTALAAHPVTLGIPLPEGARQDLRGFRVLGPDGRPVPAQISPLLRWWAKDGSVRVAQATFLADVAAGGTAQYTLDDAGSAQVSGPLTVVDGADRVTVVTGPLRFTVRKGSGVLDQAWLDRDGDGAFSDGEAMFAENGGLRGELTFAASGLPAGITAGQKLSTASRTDAMVVVEENGPVRAVIRVEAPTAPPAQPYGYKLRIYAWKGRGDIQADFTLKNDLLGPTGQILHFDDFSLVFKPRFETAQATVAFGGDAVHSGAWGAGSRLLQPSASAYAVTGSQAASGSRAAGWLDASSASGGVQVAVREFWQQFPKALEAAEGGEVRVGLWPAGGEDGGGLYWLGDMQYKTHTVGLRFHGAGETAATASAAYAAQLARPPVAVVPVSWYAETRLPPGLLGVVPHSQTVADAYFDGPVAADTLGWRSWWNNGRKSTITTGGTPLNQTGDPFMLSGDPGFHRRLSAWARHSADIRPVHLSGYVHPMSRSWSGFTAGGYGWRSWRNTFVEYTVSGTAWDAWYPYDDEHAWVHEMEWAYLFTGDRLYLDNLAGLGELFKARLEGWAKKTTVGPRSYAWCFELVRIQHTLTGDTGAYRILTSAIDSLAAHNLNGFYGNLNGESAGTQTFQMAMIAHHLSAFWRELPEGHQKRRLFGVLMGIGDYLTVHSWADDNRGVGRRPSEKATPYYNNDDIGDIPALLYALTGRGGLKVKTGRIASSLGSWWGAWKGGRAGRMVTYVLKTARPDSTPPAAVADLKAWRVQGRDDLVLLEWTAPGDARRYDIRGSAKTPVERLAAPADTASSVNWWKARGFAHHKPFGARAGRDWTLVEAPGAASWNFSLRAFDADGDEANMSAMSNVAKPACCFDPDTLPTAVRPKGKEPRKGMRSGAVDLRLDRAGARVQVILGADGPGPADGAAEGLAPARVRILDVTGAVRADLGVLSQARPEAAWDCARAPAGVYWVDVRQAGRATARRFLLP